MCKLNVLSERWGTYIIDTRRKNNYLLNYQQITITYNPLEQQQETYVKCKQHSIDYRMPNSEFVWFICCHFNWNYWPHAIMLESNVYTKIMTKNKMWENICVPLIQFLWGLFGGSECRPKTPAGHFQPVLQTRITRPNIS